MLEAVIAGAQRLQIGRRERRDATGAGGRAGRRPATVRRRPVGRLFRVGTEADAVDSSVARQRLAARTRRRQRISVEVGASSDLIAVFTASELVALVAALTERTRQIDQGRRVARCDLVLHTLVTAATTRAGRGGGRLCRGSASQPEARSSAQRRRTLRLAGLLHAKTSV